MGRKHSGFEAMVEIWSRRKWPAVLAFAGCLSAAVSMTAALPDIYRSMATVLVEREQVAATIVRPAVTGGLDARLQTISHEILSRSRLTDLIRRFHLYPEMTGKSSDEEIAARMRREIRLELRGVEPAHGGGETVAFAISYTGRDPQVVSEVANALASFYVDENLRARERQASGTADFLRTQIAEVREQLDEQAQRLNEFNQRHMGELPQQVSANLATLERLNAQLQLNLEQQLRTIERRETLARASGDAEAAALPPGTESTAARLARLRQQLIELQTRYSGKYPDVVRTRSEIEALERELSGRKAEGKPGRTSRPYDPPSTMVGGLPALEEEERRLRRTIEAYQARVENAPRRDQELHEITRDYQATKELYESLVKRDEEARLAGTLEKQRLSEQFRILDAAVPAQRPSAPNRLRLLLFGLMISLGAAAGCVALIEGWDMSFHTLDALRSFTRVPVIASIPRIATRGDTLRRRRRLAFGSAAAVLGVSILAGASWYLAHDNEQLVSLVSRGGS